MECLQRADLYRLREAGFRSRCSENCNTTLSVSLRYLLTSKIAYAYHNSIPFLGTGGGHGYSASLGSVQNGIKIDLGHFNNFSIDGNANTITIGGSVHFANITGPLYNAGKEWRMLLIKLIFGACR